VTDFVSVDFSSFLLCSIYGQCCQFFTIVGDILCKVNFSSDFSSQRVCSESACAASLRYTVSRKTVIHVSLNIQKVEESRSYTSEDFLWVFPRDESPMPIEVEGGCVYGLFSVVNFLSLHSRPPIMNLSLIAGQIVSGLCVKFNRAAAAKYTKIQSIK